MESPKLSSISDSESSIPRLVHLQNSADGLAAGKTSAFWAIFLVVNAALGAGLLAFPLSFYMTGGVVIGVIIELVRSMTEKLANCTIVQGQWDPIIHILWYIATMAHMKAIS